MSFSDFWMNLLADPWWNGFLVAFVLFLLLESAILATRSFLRSLMRPRPSGDLVGAPLRSYSTPYAGFQGSTTPVATEPVPEPVGANSEPVEVPRFGVPELVHPYDPADYVEPLRCSVDNRDLEEAEGFWKIPAPGAGPDDPFLVICHRHVIAPAEAG
jgi:hypothetical protein